MQIELNENELAVTLGALIEQSDRFNSRIFNLVTQISEELDIKDEEKKEIVTLSLVLKATSEVLLGLCPYLSSEKFAEKIRKVAEENLAEMSESLGSLDIEYTLEFEDVHELN